MESDNEYNLRQLGLVEILISKIETNDMRYSGFNGVITDLVSLTNFIKTDNANWREQFRNELYSISVYPLSEGEKSNYSEKDKQAIKKTVRNLKKLISEFKKAKNLGIEQL